MKEDVRYNFLKCSVEHECEARMLMESITFEGVKDVGMLHLLRLLSENTLRPRR